MLCGFSQINHLIRAVRLGRIVTWKGERKDVYYVNETLVD